MLNNLSSQLTTWKPAFTRKGRQPLKTKVKPGRSDFLIYFHCQKWFLPTIWLYSCKGEWIKRQPVICPWWLGFWAPRIVQTGICSKHHLTHENLVCLKAGNRITEKKLTRDSFSKHTVDIFGLFFVLNSSPGLICGVPINFINLQRVWDY